MSGNVKP